MRPNKGRKRTNHSSPTTNRPFASSEFEPTPSVSRPSTLPLSGVSILDRQLVTEENLDFFEKLRISSPDANPRSFPYSVKKQCWDKAEKVKGRDPDRWRRDPLGNTIFRKLVGCPGCLCYEYDHIVPYSKIYHLGPRPYLYWGPTLTSCPETLPTDFTLLFSGGKEHIGKLPSFTGRDMDLLELSAYGNVWRGQDSGGCSIQ